MMRGIIIAAMVALAAHLMVLLSDKKSVSVLSAPRDSRQLEPADQEEMDWWALVCFLAFLLRFAALVSFLGLSLWSLLGH